MDVMGAHRGVLWPLLSRVYQHCQREEHTDGVVFYLHTKVSLFSVVPRQYKGVGTRAELTTEYRHWGIQHKDDGGW